MFPVSLQLFCQENPGVILANPLNCAQYFDCSLESVAEGTYLRECPYPMLFSEDTLVCQNFTSVTCRQRSEPTEPCMYCVANADTRYEPTEFELCVLLPFVLKLAT